MKEKGVQVNALASGSSGNAYLVEAGEVKLLFDAGLNAATLEYYLRQRGTAPESWLARAVRGTQEAPLTHEIAQAAVQIPLHRDPADRFLAATAQVLDMILVTADEKLLGLGAIQTLGNR